MLYRYAYLCALNAILDFLLIFTAYRLRARAAAPASIALWGSCSLSSSLVCSSIGGGKVAGMHRELPAPALPALHANIELLKDLSASVV